MSGMPFCRICQRYFNSPEQLSFHENGQLHLAKCQSFPGQIKEVAEDGASTSHLSGRLGDDVEMQMRQSPFQQVNPIASNQRQENTTLLSSAINDISKTETKTKNPIMTAESKTGMNRKLYSPQQSQQDEEFFSFDRINKKGRCFICDVELSSVKQAEDHLSSKKHKKKRMNSKHSFRASGVFSAVTQGTDASSITPVRVQGNDRNPTSPFEDPDSNILMCKVCNVPFSSTFNMEQHFSGAKHKKEMQKRENHENNVENTKKKELFATSSRSVEMLSRNLRLDPEENLNSTPFQRENSSVVTGASRKLEDTEEYDPNLSAFNNKINPIKDKQMNLKGTIPQLSSSLSSSTLSSIINNDQQPLFHSVNSMPSPNGLKQVGLQENCRGLPAIVTSSQNIIASSTPLHQQGSAVTSNLNSNNVPTPSVPALGPLPKEYEFDGVKGFCNVCDIALSSWKHAQSHLNGQQHRKQAQKWREMQVQLPSTEKRSSDTPNINDQRIGASNFASPSKSKYKDQEYYHFDGNKGFCRACNSELTSFAQAGQHLEGKPHKRNVERLWSSEQGVLYKLYCDICQKSFTGQESARQHFISDKHQRYEALLKSESTQVLEEFEGGKKLYKKGEIWYLCIVCNKFLNTLDQFNIHKKLHNPSEPENSRSSPIPNQSLLSNQAAYNYGAVGYQQAVVSDIGQLGNGPSYSRQISKSVSIDTQVSLEQIRELLKYGDNPVVNTEFSASNNEPINPSYQQQGATNSEFGTRLPMQVEDRGRMLLNDPSNNYNAHISSSNQTSGINLESFGFQPMLGSGRNGIGSRCQTAKNENGSGSSNSSGNGRDANLNFQGNRQSEESIGNISNVEGNLSIFGKVTTGCKKNASKSNTRDGNKRNIVNLDQAENLESSDDDDGENDSGANMNIQGEEKQPMSQNLPQPSPKVPCVYGVRTKNRYYCDLCNRQMNAKKSFKDHLEGKLHQWNLSSCKVPSQLQEPISKSYHMQQADYELIYNITKNVPRKYQIELAKKAMESDCVVFLPTGTGKTMVSVLTIGCMLQKNPRRPVIFLVDKVLLVIQQARYIKTEFEGKKIRRACLQRNTDDIGTDSDIIERELSLAFVCRGLLCTNNLPIWQHDIIVTTADYCINMLNNGSIQWEDFCLAVFDEVHHCVKNHPYRRLIQDYQHKIADSRKRPKILGLTASPAGKSTVEATSQMLQSLLQELGGAKIDFVGEDGQNELRSFQSNPILEQFCIPMTHNEQHFQSQCIKYFLHCYIKLAPLSNNLRKMKEVPCSYFSNVINDQSEEAMQNLTDLLLRDAEPLSEILPFIIQAKCDAKEIEEHTYESLRLHTFKVLLLIAEIPTGIVFEEVIKDFEENENNHELRNVMSLGLPCATFYKQIKIFEELEGTSETPMINKLMQILQDPSYINWANPDSMALVLVRERKNAKFLTKKLRCQKFVVNNDMHVTHLVGHGRKSQDGGMAVKDQKKVLDNQTKYKIIVATSIAEEGVDINTLELVISMNPPTNVTALVQMRGRARKKGSHFVILCSNQEEVKRLENLQQQEKNMMEAAKLLNNQ